MKRFALAVIVLSVLTAGILLSCAAPKAAVYTDDTKTIFVKVNEEFTIGIPANPTTGHQWKASHDTSLISLVDSKYKASKQAKELVGADGMQYFKFKALKAGMAVISFSYQRPSEGIVINTKSFNVVIE